MTVCANSAGQVLESLIAMLVLGFTLGGGIVAFMYGVRRGQ
jgi:hypothetical protein